VRRSATVSVFLPKPGRQVLVIGPITHDLAPYPFLDIQHHILRLGLSRLWAEKYADVLAQGGLVLCLDAQEPQLAETLREFHVHDLRWVHAGYYPKMAQMTPALAPG
jgi:hypothetical protein